MNTWADRLRLAHLLVAPPPPEAHVGDPEAWRDGWTARLAGAGDACLHSAPHYVRAWEAGYAACGVAMGKPPA